MQPPAWLTVPLTGNAARASPGRGPGASAVECLGRLAFVLTFMVVLEEAAHTVREVCDVAGPFERQRCSLCNM